MKGEVLKVIEFDVNGDTRHKVFLRDSETLNVFKCLIDFDAPTVPEVGEIWESVGHYKDMPLLGLKVGVSTAGFKELTWKSLKPWNEITPGSLVKLTDEIFVSKVSLNRAYYHLEDKIKNVGNLVRGLHGDKEYFVSFPVFTPVVVNTEPPF